MPFSAVVSTRVCVGLLLLIVSCPTRGSADCADDCVPVGQWQINLGVGVGLRENPLVGGEHTPLLVLPEISWYGKRFFLNNLEFGVTVLENRRHQLNALITPSFQQMHFNRWDPFNFFEASSGAALAEPALGGLTSRSFNVHIDQASAPEEIIDGLEPGGSGNSAGPMAIPALQASGVSSVWLNGQPVRFSHEEGSLLDSGTGAVTAVMRNGQLHISGLRESDHLELRGADVTINAEGRAAGEGLPGNVTVAPGETALYDPDAETRGAVSSQDVRRRKMAGLAGLEYLYSGQGWQWHTQALQDVSGVHRGHEVRAALILPRQVGEHRFALTIGTNYQSRKVLDYYYGVHEADTPRADLQFEPAGAGFSHMVRVDWQKPVSEHWSLRGLIKVTSLVDEIRNSPLVEQDYSAAVFFGGVYHF